MSSLNNPPLMLPDYSAGVNVTNNYVCAYPCLIDVITNQSQNLTGLVVSINNIKVFHQTDGDAAYNKRFTATAYATTGDQINVDSDVGFDIYVYPLKRVV